MPKCSYCDYPAIGQVDDVALCLHCLDKLREMDRQSFNQNAAMANHALAYMNSLVGIDDPSGMIPLIPARQPSHNIRVNSPSVEGNNYGIVSGVAIGNLTNSIGQLTDEVEPDVIERLKAFSAAISSDGALSEDQKAEIAETLTAITEQLKTPKAEQKPRMTANLMKLIPTLITASNGLVTLWGNLAVPISRALGIH